MAYSTVAQFRANCNSSRVTVTAIPDATVDDRIDQADNTVEIDLSKVVDFDEVTDTPAGCPAYINKLSQYKTAELSLVNLFSGKRLQDEAQSDWEYWKLKYDKLLEDILAGKVDLGDAGIAATYSKRFRDGIEPALGQNKYGDWANDDDIEDIRGEFGEQD